MIIGITGGTGCGKTTLLEELRKLGATILDCDRIYHDLLVRNRKLLTAIETRFPGTVENGQLLRKKLGDIVFTDPQALQDLNAITHAAIKAEVIRQLEGTDFAAIDAVALLESGLSELCDLTVAVTAPEDLRIARLMSRDGITREYAQNRINAQPREAWFRQNCDYVLENDSDIPSFQSKCLAFFHTSGIINATPPVGEGLDTSLTPTTIATLYSREGQDPPLRSQMIGGTPI
ncbi:MAG: dephospho-CoA kinase [Oscillospiraceae bacterium]|nr:dephospho-CoA kinase [Oscillospiraceae bacterium]